MIELDKQHKQVLAFGDLFCLFYESEQFENILPHIVTKGKNGGRR